MFDITLKINMILTLDFSSVKKIKCNGVPMLSLNIDITNLWRCLFNLLKKVENKIGMTLFIWITLNKAKYSCKFFPRIIYCMWPISDETVTHSLDTDSKWLLERTM